MFGYIKAHKPELKCRDYDIYKGVYCSLCKSLARRYTPLAQLALTYDAALLAVFGLARAGHCPGLKNSRCMYNPFVRCMTCRKSEEVDSAADVSVIMLYHKLRDDLKDRGILKKLRSALLLPAVSLMRRKARKKAPYAEEAICAAMEKQAEVEKRRVGVDEASEPSSTALGEILSHGCEDACEREKLFRLGYLVGRFAYLADAADDLFDDLKRGGFNPFAERAGELEGEALWESVSGTLTLTAGEAAKASKELEYLRFGEIVDNIFFDGLYFAICKIGRRYVHEKFV